MVEAEDPQHPQTTRTMASSSSNARAGTGKVSTKTERGRDRTKAVRAKREGTCEDRKEVQEQVQEAVREVVEEVPPSTTNQDVRKDAVQKDQDRLDRSNQVYTMVRGFSNHRKEPWVSIDNEESEMDFQQFVYQPIIRDRSVSYILQIQFGKRLTATVRFNECFNTVEALRFLVGEFEIDTPSCKRTESLQYRITQLEVLEVFPSIRRLRTRWICAPVNLLRDLKISPGEISDQCFTQGSLRNFMTCGLVYDGLDCVLIGGPADHFNIREEFDENGNLQEFRDPTPSVKRCLQRP